MDEPGIIAERLQTKFALEVMTPQPQDRAAIDRVIQTELVKGLFTDASRAEYRAIMAGWPMPDARRSSWAAPKSRCW